MLDVGTTIGERGWRQGSILRDDDFRVLGERCFKDRYAAGTVGLVVSQSCDLTHKWLEGEPVAEILVGHLAEDEAAGKRRGNYSGGKHPRCLHLPVQIRAGGVRWFEFLPWNRVAVDRSTLVDRTPDSERYVLPPALDVMTNWLAQRYIRVAFPDGFNALLEGLRDVQKKLHARLSPAVSGLYAKLHPDRDLLEEERYTVNLLALVPDSHESQLATVNETVEKLAHLIRSAGIDILSAAVLESEVSYARLRSYKRFPLEHLSLRSDPPDPMPVELSTDHRRG